jgi:hypothetical protein
MVVPVATDVTRPVDEPIVAMEVLLLLHVPPPTPLLSSDVAPRQMPRVPVIAVGAVFTVTVIVE